MFDFSAVFAKMLEFRTILIPAGALTFVTALFYPNIFTGDTEAKLLWLAGIFCVWASILMSIAFIYVNYRRPIARSFADKRKLFASRLLPILSPEQFLYLTYIKWQGHRTFQAREGDQTIIGLTSLGLLKKAIRIDGEDALYTVPRLVWRKLKMPDDEQKRVIVRMHNGLAPWRRNSRF